VTIAVYPGRFDPVTNGHLDIIRRAAKLFERVVVAVYDAPERPTLFTAGERVALIRESIQDLSNVSITSFHGLVVDFARRQNATAIVRGIRKNADFEYEFEMALMNRKLAPDIDVVCLMTDLQYQYVRASLLREVARLGGDVTSLAPPNVITALRAKQGQRKS